MCVYVCMCVCMYVCVHVCSCMCVLCLFSNVCAETNALLQYIPTHACMYVYMYVCSNMRPFPRWHRHMHVCMYVCMYVCIHVYVYPRWHRHMHTHMIYTDTCLHTWFTPIHAYTHDLHVHIIHIPVFSVSSVSPVPIEFLPNPVCMYVYILCMCM